MANKRKEMFKILDEVQVLPEQRRELVQFINCLFDALERSGYVMGSMHGAANRVTPFNASVVQPSALEVAAHENSGDG